MPHSLRSAGIALLRKIGMSSAREYQERKDDLPNVNIAMDLAGHSQLKTNDEYNRSSLADRARAMDRLGAMLGVLGEPPEPDPDDDGSPSPRRKRSDSAESEPRANGGEGQVSKPPSEPRDRAAENNLDLPRSGAGEGTPAVPVEVLDRGSSANASANPRYPGVNVAESLNLLPVVAGRNRVLSNVNGPGLPGKNRAAISHRGDWIRTSDHLHPMQVTEFVDVSLLPFKYASMCAF